MQRKRADLAPLRRSQRHSERLDLSLVAFFGKQKVAMGVYKGAKCRISVSTREKLGHTCDQIGRTLEPCIVILFNVLF